MARKFKKFDYVLAKGNEGRALEIAEAMEKSGFKIWGKRQGYKLGKWDAIAIDHCGDIILCGTTDPACQNLVEFAQDDQVTLAPGDYVSTAGMTEDQYHAVARAFMAAGAVDHGDSKVTSKTNFLGWDDRDDGFWSHHDVVGGFTGRQLTISQALNATNAGNKEEDMTPCEKLGYKVGDRFRVIYSRHPDRDGSIITLSRDDGTRSPFFKSPHGDTWIFRIDNSRNDVIEKVEDDTLTQTLRDAAEHDTKAKHHAAEHDRLMQRAREMLPDGWRLVRDGEHDSDMDDPANWREGDVVEVLKDGAGGYSFEEGEKHRIGIDGDGDVVVGPLRLFFTERECRTQLKWHHRPT